MEARQPTPINFGASLDRRQLRRATLRVSVVSLSRPLDIRVSIEARAYGTNIREHFGERLYEISYLCQGTRV